MTNISNGNVSVNDLYHELLYYMKEINGEVSKKLTIKGVVIWGMILKVMSRMYEKAKEDQKKLEVYENAEQMINREVVL